MAAVERVMVIAAAKRNRQPLPRLNTVLQPYVVGRNLLPAVIAHQPVQATIFVLHPFIAALQKLPRSQLLRYGCIRPVITLIKISVVELIAETSVRGDRVFVGILVVAGFVQARLYGGSVGWQKICDQRIVLR